MIKIKPKLTPLQRAQHILALKESSAKQRRIHELLDKRNNESKKPKIIRSVAGIDSPRDLTRFGETEAIAEGRKPRKNR